MCAICPALNLFDSIYKYKVSFKSLQLKCSSRSGISYWRCEQPQLLIEICEVHIKCIIMTVPSHSPPHLSDIEGHTTQYSATVMQTEPSLHLGDYASLFYNASHSGQMCFISITQLFGMIVLKGIFKVNLTKKKGRNLPSAFPKLLYFTEILRFACYMCHSLQFSVLSTFWVPDFLLRLRSWVTLNFFLSFFLSF